MFNLLFICTGIGIHTTTFLFACLDENWRRLSRPRRSMTRAMARLPRIMWGRRFTLQRSFSFFQRRSWQPPSPPRPPPKRSPMLLKPPRPQTIMSLAWQWPGVRGSCQGLSQPGTSPAGWRWRAQPGTKRVWYLTSLWHFTYPWQGQQDHTKVGDDVHAHGGVRAEYSGENTDR